MVSDVEFGLSHGILASHGSLPASLASSKTPEVIKLNRDRAGNA